MQHRTKYVGTAVHPHNLNRTMHLYKCEDCGASFARLTPGPFVSGTCDMAGGAIQASEPTNTAIAATLRTLAKALPFWPGAARALTIAANRLQALGDIGQAKRHKSVDDYWAEQDSPFATGGFVKPEREWRAYGFDPGDPKGDRSEFRFTGSGFTRSDPVEEVLRNKDRIQEELLRQLRKGQSHASAYQGGAEDFTKPKKPFTNEELAKLYGEFKKKHGNADPLAKPYYRRNERY